jgi:hypothetical protein
MPQWFGKPVPFTRFLGQVDQDDPTNLPVGLAAVCKNTDFTRDSPGVTCANTRAGNNLAIQLVAADGKSPSKEPVTGGIFFKYEPELSTEAALFPPAGYFEMPIFFDAAANLQRESPSGSGRCQLLPTSPIVPLPTKSKLLGVPAGNKVWGAFTDGQKPTGAGICINPKAIRTNGANPVTPLGMKPFGWYWQPNTPVLQNEVCCPASPSTGNGHTYQAQNSGTTGANQPGFSANDAEGQEYNDNGIIWKELTMVLANRLPPPSAPTLTRETGTGTFPADEDVYVILTFVNPQGESLPGLPSKITNTVLDNAVLVAIPTLASLPGWIRSLTTPYAPTECNVYVATVATGSPAPPTSVYELAGATALGSTRLVTAQPSGANPPNASTARVVPGQLPTPTDLVDIQRDSGGGTFPAGRDVYVLQTYKNANGETKAGPTNYVLNTVLNDGVQVTVAVPEDDNNNPLYSIESVGIYEADVPTGTPAPPSTAFCLVGSYAAGATPIITETATGSNPPTSNTTGPAGNIQADTATGGANGTQGFRYAVPLFMNSNETVSGFTIAAVSSYIVDEDGWELAAFNIATGPSNVVARLVAFSIADSSQDGPFWWIGLIDLIVPSQNVVYPTQTLIDQVNQGATAIFDNTTTQAVFNFTDDYLDDQNNVDDRTDILPPFQACRIDYLKSINALAFSGVLGYSGGGLISVPGDYESVYADTGQIPFPTDGQKCFGFTDAYKSQILALREQSGYAIQPNSGNPAGWDVVRRWTDHGPCGFDAWDAIGKFVFWIEESGAYKYDQSDPDMMSKEVPRAWSTINWRAKAGFSVTIDEDTHTVRIQVATGQSMVNNKEFCLSYLEGWQNPIHFSTFSGKEISMDAARRWSFNDFAANKVVRMRRTLPPGTPAYADGPNWEAMPDSTFAFSQLLYLDAGADGGVQARTPGVFSDNGQGIDWEYETMCAGMMQMVCKPEGVNLNATGQGIMKAFMIPARDEEDDPGGPQKNLIQLGGDDGFALNPNQVKGITLKCEPVINEFWRVHFDNGKQPGAWCSLKQMTVYLIPFTVARGAYG